MDVDFPVHLGRGRSCRRLTTAVLLQGNLSAVIVVGGGTINNRAKRMFVILVQLLKARKTTKRKFPELKEPTFLGQSLAKIAGFAVTGINLSWKSFTDDCLSLNPSGFSFHY